MAYFEVDTTFYIKNKLVSLQNNPETAAAWVGKTEEDLAKYFADNNVDAQAHFEQYGWKELLSANASFDVKAYLTAKANSLDLTVAEVIAAFEQNDLNVVEHYEQYGKDEIARGDFEFNAGTSSLTEALATYQAAVAAEEGFLKDLASNSAFLATLPAADAETVKTNKTAAASDVALAVTTTTLALDAALGGGVIADAAGELTVGENTLTGILADAKALAAANVKTEQEDLVVAQNATGLTAAIKANLKSASARLDAAYAAEANADKANTETTRQESIAEANLTALPSTDLLDDGGTPSTDPNFYIDATGEFKAGVSETAKAAVKPYLAAVKAQESADKNVTTTFTALTTALETAGVDMSGGSYADLAALETANIVAEVQTNGEVTGYELDSSAFTGAAAGLLDAQSNLATAKAEEATLLKAINAFNLANGFDAKYEELTEAVANAYEAITDSVEDGGLGIALKEVDGSLIGLYDTTDLFVFSGKQGEISFFEAEDQLFFGTKYTFVELASTVDMSKDRVGDDAVLEIFYQAKDGNITFFVEEEAEAGRDVVKNDIVEVVLTGVTEVATADGFVTLA